MSEYIHVGSGTEVILMATIFKITAGGCLAYGNRNLLYIEGFTTVGSACSGAMECHLIHVPGFVVSWHYKIDKASGNPISIVEPITDPSTQEDVKKRLCRIFPSSLFLFS